MSRIIIETFTRDAEGGWSSSVAIAHYDGQLIANGGVGSGDSERQAVQDAINSLYTRADERDRAEAPGWIGSPVIESPEIKTPALSTETAGSSPMVHREYTTTSQIVAVLKVALTYDPKPKFRLFYKDADDVETEREIIPAGLDDRRGIRGFRSGGEMLVAIDTAKDEPRHFRIDRIQKLVPA